MELDKTEYCLERTADGGFLACLTYNMQCCAFGDTAEEAIDNLGSVMEEYIDEMYLVESF